MLDARGLEYETRGTGEPVLLIHGSHVAGSFLPLVRDGALAERYLLIRYHRRGFAGSDRAPAGFRIEDQARDAFGLLEDLDIERAHVIGHSYGAVIAIQLACQAPHAVHSLTLLEPPLMTPDTAAAFSGQLTPIVDAYRAGNARGAIEGFMGAVCKPDWQAITARAVPGGAEQAEKDAATFFDVEFPALASWAFDAERARRIVQPALYVLGGDSAPVFQASRALFASSVPHAECAELPGLDHLLQVRNPKRVAGAIAAFLERHPLR
jgi:pimeloyl-ACP methyl ester carboxylesterase